MDPCGVGWLGQKNDNKFIQELQADSCCGWIRGRTHSLLQEKAALPCRARTAQSCSTSHEQFTRKDPFEGITESDVEDAAPESLIIDASDTADAIDVEID